MNNPKASDAARVSAANALLDRGYGKPPQHITGESGTAYVVRLPEVAKSVEEWEASVQADIRAGRLPASDQDRQRLQGQIEGDRSRGLMERGIRARNMTL